MRKFIIKSFASYHKIDITFCDVVWITSEIIFSVLMYLKLISFLTYFLSPLITMTVFDGIGIYLYKYKRLTKLDIFWNRPRYIFSIQRLLLWSMLPISLAIVALTMRTPLLNIIWLFIIPYCFYTPINLYLTIKPIQMDEVYKLVDKYNIAKRMLPYRIIDQNWNEADKLYDIIAEYEEEKEKLYNYGRN